MQRWTSAQVGALAPDPSSLTAARGTRWEVTGLAGEFLWGLSLGSGKTPYQVCVDLSGPAYKCSCPSRKFPCKHALGLLLRWASDGVDQLAPPAFVTDWQKARAAASARQTSAAPDPAAAAKRAAQRADRVAGGLAELRRWLDDQVRQGLAAAERSGHRPYEAMAARLVDAQAPAAASAVRRLGAIAGIGPQWADRLLGELGLLRLLVTAHARLDSLPPGLAATVRTRIGFPVSGEDVLAGPRVRDRWQVLGQIDSDDGALMSRRVWLRGAATGRFALVLTFAAPGQSLGADLLIGTELDADLCFYPGALPLRALVAARHAEPVPVTAPAGATSLDVALAGWSAALAAEPWRHDVPVLLSHVVPSAQAPSAPGGPPGVVSPGGWLVDADGAALPLAPGHRAPWWLLAAAGGRPATVAAEWSAAGLRPLGAWVDGVHVPAAAPEASSGAAARGPELPPDLLAAALVGTARRPWRGPTVSVGGQPLTIQRPSTADSAAELLEAAAVALTYRRAGVAPSAGHIPVGPAPDEADGLLPAAANARLRLILSDGGAPGGAQAAQELLAQWLGLAETHGGRVPPDTLPALLEAGRRNGGIRAALAQVSGRRGAWLAAMRPDWAWLLGEAPAAGIADWDTGSPGERLGYLRRLRADDPAGGRELLAQAWEAEPSAERARLLTALETGLSTADDTFLEQALDDRRREVREVALDLARRLPGSSLGARMTARALTAVRVAKRTLGRDRLIVEPPEELDPALRRDGVEATPARGIGPGAWLLEEIVAGTPLEVWTPGFGREPADVLGLAHGHDWESPLVHGWAKAAIAQRDNVWAQALVRDDAQLREAVRWDLHLVLPPAELARIAADFLRREDHLAHRLLAVHQGDWPDELAVAVVETIARRARTDRHSWQLSELCRSAAMAMPPRYAPQLTRLAGQLDQESTDPSRIRPVAELARTLTFRHEMHLEFE